MAADMRRRIAAKYVAIGVAVCGAGLWLELTGRLDRWAGAVDPALEALAGLGVAGTFLLGVLGNSSVLLQVPYVLPILSAALAGADLRYIVALAVAAALGATLGELVSFGVAHVLLGRADLTASRMFHRVRRSVEDHPRRTPWLVFVFALTFLPDDVLLVALAMVGYGVRRLLLPLLLGKLGYTLGCAVLFHAVGEAATALVSQRASSDLALLVVVALVLVVLYQVEVARAGSVEGQQGQGGRPGGTDGAQGQDRAGGRLRPGVPHPGGGGGHHAPRGP